MPKKNHVIHYRNLKYYLLKGWIFKKVHKILEFKQSAWMKPYIDFNTQKRKEANNEADKNLFKLLNNTVYGKTRASKRAIQKSAEATGDLIGNKSADKITSVSKKPSNNNNKNDGVELTPHKKRYISPEERQQIINELRLVPKKYV